MNDADKAPAWVYTVPVEDAKGIVKQTYDANLKALGYIANISRPFGNRPEIMRAHRRLYLTLMQTEENLTKAEREFIATAVSKENDCFY